MEGEILGRRKWRPTWEFAWRLQSSCWTILIDNAGLG